MSNTDPYKAAYEREREARKLAENLLDEKTRNLYDNIVELQSTVDALESAQEQLIQSEKMASIGQLAAGVAHEINNPIGFSLSNISTLSEYIESFIQLDKIAITHLPTLQDHELAAQYQTYRKKEDIDFIKDDLKELIDDTIKGLNRVSVIVANLKKVTHSGELEMEQGNINDIIEESVKVVWNELKYNMEVTKQFSTLPMIPCHTGEIHQILMNLFINASHACSEKGMLTIKTTHQKGENRDWVVIDIMDNGKGMSKEVRKKIFDPFFTTKAVGVGTGLGLSITHGIIEKHEGRIKVASQEGKGTVFTISLPVTQLLDSSNLF